MVRAVLLSLLCLCSPSFAGPAAELRVFAAASLREPFSALARGFEAKHPGVTVAFNFAGSQELRLQLENGASADVVATADLRHMGALESAKLVDAPTLFARNELVIVLAKGQVLSGLEALPSIKKLVIGAPEVPVGKYSLELLDRAGAVYGKDFRQRVEARVVSRELNVRQVLAKVALGEADAGIVYLSDARSAPAGVGVVSIPRAQNVLAAYPIARARGAAQPKLADEWIALVRSDEGRRVLVAGGFLPPEGP
jgi:molybdate transport system substrate-binding protein